MKNETIIEKAFNYTKELLKTKQVNITTTSGRELNLQYLIEEEEEYIIHSIRTECSILEQEIWISTDEDGNETHDGQFNTGLVHSHIIGLIRNY